MAEKRLYDYLFSFPKGMDGGVDPLLLPKDQLANSVNATVRGDFIAQRPTYKTIPMALDLPYAAAFLPTGVFQGAGYYSPDTGPESIVMAVGGTLLKVTPDAFGGSTVDDITIPGDPIPTSQFLTWMKQAENYLIVNDGLSLPIYYDGASSRRSLGPVSLFLGTVVSLTNELNPPAIGGTIAITLAAPYPGKVGDVIYIDDATYLVVQGGGITATYTVTLKQVYDTVASYPSGQGIRRIPSRIGYNMLPFPVDFHGPGVQCLPNNTLLQLPGFLWDSALYPLLGGTVNLNMGVIFNILPDGSLRTSGQWCSAPASYNFQAFQLVSYLNSTIPSKQVAILSSPFTPPGNGNAATAALVSNFGGSIGDVLWLGDGQYIVTAINPTQPQPAQSNTITVENLNAPSNHPIYDPMLWQAAASNSILPGYPLATNSGTVYGGISVVVGKQAFRAVTSHPYPPDGCYPVAGFGPGNGSVLSSLPELPPGRMLDYGMGRVWEALTDGFSFIAGDIVCGSSGSPNCGGRDAVLKVTENDTLFSGGAFRVPGGAGQITAMQFIAMLDVAMGQGPMQVFTTLSVFGCQAPTDRTTWQGLSTPILPESLKGAGGISQWSVSPSSGDLLFRSSDGALRSLLMARLDFNKWGNTPISREMQQVMDAEDKTLLFYDSSATFNNRCLLLAHPISSPRGTYFTSILALNFDPKSGLQGKAPSVWDGEWTGMKALRIISGMFGGMERCFAICLSDDLLQIELREIRLDTHGINDEDTTKVTWFFESPSLFLGQQGQYKHDYKRLMDGEVYFDKLQTDVVVEAYYKCDQYPAWVPWYSTTIKYQPNDPGFRPRVGLGLPNAQAYDKVNNRPLREGFAVQVKVVVTGYARCLGARFAADLIPEPEFAQPKPLM